MPESLIEQQLMGMEDSSPGLTLKCNAGTLTAFLKGEVTLSCGSFKSLQGINTVK